jgi:hypothetical protein
MYMGCTHANPTCKERNKISKSGSTVLLHYLEKRIKTRSQMPNEEFSRDYCGANHDMMLFVNTLPKSVSYN